MSTAEQAPPAPVGDEVRVNTAESAQPEEAGSAQNPPETQSTDYLKAYRESAELFKRYCTFPVKIKLGKPSDALPQKVTSSFAMHIIKVIKVPKSSELKNLVQFMIPSKAHSEDWLERGCVCFDYDIQSHDLNAIFSGQESTAVVEGTSSASQFHCFHVCKEQAFRTAVTNDILRDGAVLMSDIIDAIKRIKCSDDKAIFAFPVDPDHSLLIDMIDTLRKSATLEVSPLQKPVPTAVETVTNMTVQIKEKRTVNNAISGFVGGKSKSAVEEFNPMPLPSRTNALPAAPTLGNLIMSHIIFLTRHGDAKLRGPLELRKETRQVLLGSIDQMCKHLAFDKSNDSKRQLTLWSTIKDGLHAGTMSCTDLSKALIQLQDTVMAEADPVLIMTKKDRLFEYWEKYKNFFGHWIYKDAFPEYEDIIEYMLGHEQFISEHGKEIDFCKCICLIKLAIAVDLIVGIDISNPDRKTRPGICYIANVLRHNMPKWLSIHVFIMFYRHNFNGALVERFMTDYVNDCAGNQAPVECIIGNIRNNPLMPDAWLDHPSIFGKQEMKVYCTNFNLTTALPSFDINVLMDAMELNIISSHPVVVTRSRALLMLEDKDIAKGLLNAPNAFKEPETTSGAGSASTRRRKVMADGEVIEGPRRTRARRSDALNRDDEADSDSGCADPDDGKDPNYVPT